MTRGLFGGRVGDQVVSLFTLGSRSVLALPVDANGDAASISLTVWTAPGGDPITDLLAADAATPIDRVVVPRSGQVPEFYGPDNVTVLYVRDPDGDFYRFDLGPTGPAGAPGDVSLAQLEAASAADRARTNHTGQQTASTISDLTESVQDIVGAFFANGVQTQVVYDDANNTLKVNATGADAETMRDTIGAALVGIGNVSVVVNDAADTITISLTGIGSAAAKNVGTASGEVALLGTGGRFDIARLASGSPDGSKFVRDDGVLATPASGGSSAPLTVATYNPAALQVLSTTSTNAGEINAALRCTFTFPASGRVKYVFSGSVRGFGRLSVQNVSNSNNVPNSSLQISENNSAPINAGQFISGTPGTTVTWTMTFRASNSNTIYVNAGGSNAEYTLNDYGGPVTLAVYAA